jgi:hypothetical protein
VGDNKLKLQLLSRHGSKGQSDESIMFSTEQLKCPIYSTPFGLRTHLRSKSLRLIEAINRVSNHDRILSHYLLIYIRPVIMKFITRCLRYYRMHSWEFPFRNSSVHSSSDQFIYNGHSETCLQKGYLSLSKERKFSSLLLVLI